MSLCPNCGHTYTETKCIGRPKKLDDRKILEMRKKGKSLAEIAHKYGVTRGAIQASLKRSTYGV